MAKAKADPISSDNQERLIPHDVNAAEAQVRGGIAADERLAVPTGARWRTA